MKKLLSLMMVCLCAFGAMAGEVVFDPAVTRGTRTAADGADEMMFEGVTIKTTKGAFNPTTSGNVVNEYRFAKSSETTISCDSKITKIVFDCIDKVGSTSYGGDGFAAMDGMTVSEDTKTVTWTGNANEVKFTASGHQVRATKITITIDGEATPTIGAPTFSPAGGTYYVAQNVEIKAASGATIYYTTDGSDPTTASAVYSEPINVASTTTIKAIATKDDLVSSVASATYTIEQITTVNNIAEYVALGTGAYAAIANPVTVYFVKGQNVWVMDESGRMCIYGKVVGNMNYKSGDVIPGGFGGYLKEYNGGPEMTFEGDQDLFGFQEATIHGDAIAPEVVTTANVSTDIWGHYVVIKKATVSDVNNKNFNINDAAGTLAGYNGMNITLPTDLEVEYNITGIVASHNNNVQLLPSNFEKIINIDDLSTVDNIAALLATAEGTDVKISNPVTVVYQNGENLYIQDESAWTLVFGQLDNTYNNGDILTGIAGSWKTYYQIIEMIPLAESFGEATPGTAVEPEVLAIEELSTNLVHKFIKIDNCTMTKVDDLNYNLNDETGDLTMYLKFNGVTAPEDLTATYNVSGFLTLYKPKDAETAIMEFYPVEFEKVGGEPQPVPGDVNGDGEVTGSDVTALYNHILFGQDTEIFNGDQNGDGEVTGSDVTAVYNIILGL
ncbi:MAG: chitobiase/beta-hexosaminidase C-terminal domain-containing protein [Bacteroidales bacterium]|nr:chitobiase/beta-hexosaminidase C-terminal domain-containing protein [Bacteroidales bacterium]